MNIINIHTDGGSRGNPGPAAYGFYITDYTGKKIHAEGKIIGVTTNNVAEYTAVIESLSWVLRNKELVAPLKKINIFMDSRLVVMQALGKFRIKNPNLFSLLTQLRKKESELDCEITYTHVPREQNRNADRYVNLALDGKV